jgi:O-antigen ligase/polysaccharide polymerase Wzy-like membrane protein
MAITYDAVEEDFAPRRHVSAGIQRLALLYLWITIAISGVVYFEPAPYDALMIGAVILLPLVGLAPFTRGLAVYLVLLSGIVAGGFIAATQAGQLGVPATHVTVTFYLALSSVVMAAFVAHNPVGNVRLIMSAYMVAALVAATAALIGYFGVVPGLYDIFTEFGRARGTFKDPNVLGAFLVPALLYAFNVVLTARFSRASLWTIALPLLLFGTLLSFSRGAWLNLAVSLAAYSVFTFIVAVTNRERAKLIISMVLAGVCAVSVLAAAQSIPKVAEVMGERASFEQTYDLGPEGRFGGQKKAAELVVTHPLGIGALEFGRRYHHEDVHEVYLNMFLNTGWIGGTLYIFLVLATLVLGLKLVLRDRSSDRLSAVLVAAFCGMALEGAVIDTDHWRHFYLIMAMIWGMALARPRDVRDRSA